MTGELSGTPGELYELREAVRTLVGQVASMNEIQAISASSYAAAAAAEAKAVKTESDYRLLVEGTRDYAIFMLSPEGTVLTWNSGAERMKGYTAKEIIGSNFEKFYPVEKRDSGYPAKELAIAEREGRYEDQGWRVRKNGSNFWANVTITALRDDEGHLRGFSKVTRDLTGVIMMTPVKVDLAYTAHTKAGDALLILTPILIVLSVAQVALLVLLYLR